MNSPYDSVDVFHGNGAVETPTPKGMAAAWNWLKAQVGNTHPGPCTPYGMVSVCPYSGAYPTGYGLYDVSTHGRAPKRYNVKTATGFTHFHPSGIGNTELFYNYVKVIPIRGNDRPPQRWKLERESARPGFYEADLVPAGIHAELTASPRAACHRYTFQESPEPMVAIDLSAGGINCGGYKTRPTSARVRRHTGGNASGHVMMSGWPVHFCIQVDGGEVASTLWRGTEELRGRRELALDESDAPHDTRFGIAFRARNVPDAQLTVRIGFSFRSVERARANLRQVTALSFEEVREESARLWADHLGRIRVEGASAADRTVFYSCLYHSSVKPMDCADESPLWNDAGPFYADFATLWDMYKTTLPLMLTICPERATSLVQTMLRAMEAHGRFPTGYMLCTDFDRFEGQASALAHHTVADAFFRGVEGIDWGRAVKVLADALKSGKGSEFAEKGRVLPYTHTLDLAAACDAVAHIAEHTGQDRLHDYLWALSESWRNVYDDETGLLGTESEYYEGTHWNYSFRLLPDMISRIKVAGGVGGFVKQLDTFFGYEDIASGAIDPDPDPLQFKREFHHDRFEGLNNEPDMETPYAYIWAGRHDRTAEIVRRAMRHQFCPGAGGLPGNDDSGGLSSWFVWNATGLFPVTGQDLYLIGSPLFDSAAITCRGGTFTVRADGNTAHNFYVQSAKLDGEPLDRAWLRVAEVENGGELELVMGPEPTRWANANLPPGVER